MSASRVSTPHLARAEPPIQVYRILRESEWLEMAASGVFHGADADRRDGYIHLSSRDQLAGTIATHFDGVRDLVVLEVDASAIASALRWERSRGGDLFPHLYGALPLHAVSRKLDVEQFL